MKQTESRKKHVKRLLLTMACLTLSANWSSAAGFFTILSADIAPYRQALDGFQGAVRERNGALQNVVYILGREESEGIVRQIAAERPQIVYAVGPEAVKLAKERIRNTPVVFSMVLQAPGRQNLTGVALEIPVRAKLERIRKVLPDAGTIGVVYTPGSAHLYRELVQGCRALGLKVAGREIDSGKELPDAFSGMARQIDLFFMLPDTRVFSPKSIEYLLVEALKSKVPVVGLASSYTRAGALISFEADYADVGRQAGEIAVRLLEGERLQNIGPFPPRRIKTSLNLSVAERLGIKLDAQVIREANVVFK